MNTPELKKVNWEMIRDAGHKDPNLYIWFLEMYGHDEVEYGQIQQWFKEHAVAEWPQWFQQNILPLISPPQPKFKVGERVYNLKHDSATNEFIISTDEIIRKDVNKNGVRYLLGQRVSSIREEEIARTPDELKAQWHKLIDEARVREE